MNASDEESGVVTNVLVAEDVEWCEESPHNHFTSSLPILGVDQSTKETLMECIHKSEVTLWLTKITGNYWPADNSHAYLVVFLFKAYFLLGRTSLVLLCAFYLYLSVSFSWSIFGLCITSTIVVDTMSVFPAQYINQLRLRQKARFQDALVINQSARIATGYGAVFLLSSTIFLVVYLIDPPVIHNSAALVGYLIVFVVGEVALCGYLTFNLFMLFMDLKVASISIDQLIILARKKCLSMRTFNTVRSDIKHRQDISKYAADLIILPCIASAIAIIVLFTDHSFHNLSFVLILLKELIYVAAAFWYVAKVNEQADSLTRILGAEMWQTNANDANNISAGRVSDAERLSIVATSMLEPISFTLLFQRLSVENVVLSFVGFGISVFVGVVKQAVGV